MNSRIEYLQEVEENKQHCLFYEGDVVRVQSENYIADYLYIETHSFCFRDTDWASNVRDDEEMIRLAIAKHEASKIWKVYAFYDGDRIDFQWLRDEKTNQFMLNDVIRMVLENENAMWNLADKELDFVTKEREDFDPLLSDLSRWRDECLGKVKFVQEVKANRQNSLWYGGEVVRISSDDSSREYLSIVANGDVLIDVLINGSLYFESRDTMNFGIYGRSIRQIAKDDDEMEKVHCCEHPTYTAEVYEHNWWEVFAVIDGVSYNMVFDAESDKLSDVIEEVLENEFDIWEEVDKQRERKTCFLSVEHH